MEYYKLPIDGAFRFQLKTFGDERGSFHETFRKEIYEEIVMEEFVQDNISHSANGILRGMHFQKSSPQGHLVTVVQGRIFDVGIDLRPHSNTFKKSYSQFLDAKQHEQLFFPKGVAHGFLSMSEETIIYYKCTGYYKKDDEGGVHFNSIGVDWPTYNHSLTERDNLFKNLEDMLENDFPRVTS